MAVSGAGNDLAVLIPKRGITDMLAVVVQNFDAFQKAAAADNFRCVIERDGGHGKRESKSQEQADQNVSHELIIRKNLDPTS